MTDKPLDDLDANQVRKPDTPTTQTDAFEHVKPHQPDTIPFDTYADDEEIPTWGSTLLADRAYLTFAIQHGDPQPLQIELQIFINDVLVIGRSYPGEPDNPDVDLAEFGGQALGVSRRHMQFIKEDGVLKVMDLGSTNGSQLNGIKLQPNRPRIMRLGDRLTLGKLLLHLIRIT